MRERARSSRMRAGARPFWLAAAGVLAVVAIQAVSAFQVGDLSPRAVMVQVVADSGAYLSLAVNDASPHKCFVSESGSTGKLSVSFGSVASCPGGGSGTGLNAGSATDSRSSRYAFHSLLHVTNRGTDTVRVWANATTTTGSGSLLETAIKPDGVAMSDADYATTTATPLVLAPGERLQVGLRASTGTLDSGTVAGALDVAARR